MVGLGFEAVPERGKYLLFSLDNGTEMVIRRYDRSVDTRE